MFKKPPSLGTQKNLLGNKDKKKLRAALAAQFPTWTDEALDELLPPKEEVVTTRFQGSKTHVYFCRDEPILFDLNGDLFPTVYALWRRPALLPCFVTHSPVSSFLLKGADLMSPGVIPPSDGFGSDFDVDAKWAVRVVGNRFPFCVGKAVTSREQFLRSGSKGKCLQVVHHFPDGLWQTGTRAVPNSLFTAKRILSGDEEDSLYDAQKHLAEGTNPSDDRWEEGGAADGSSSSGDGSGVGGGNVGEEDGKEGGVGGGTEGAAAEGEATGAEPQAATEDDADAAAEARRREEGDDGEVAAAVSPAAAEEEAAGEEEGGDGGGSSAAATPSKAELQLTVAQMDDVLRWCLLEVAHSSVSDDHLPLDISALYSKMAVEAAAVVCTDERRRKLMEGGVCPDRLSAVRRNEVSVGLDVKRSSHKKLTKLFQSLAKEKVLTTKETRGGVLVVTINRSHPSYTSFTPVPESLRRQVAAATLSFAAAGGGAEGTAACAATSSSAAPTGGGGGASGGGKMEGPQVLEFYQPARSQTKVFTAVGVQCGKEAFFSSSEVREVMTKYIASLPGEAAAEFPTLPGGGGGSDKRAVTINGRGGVKRLVDDEGEDDGVVETPPGDKNAAATAAAGRGVPSASSSNSSSATVVLDNLLRTVLTTKEEGRVTSLSKEEVFMRWTKSLQPCHAVLKPGADIRVEPPKIVKGHCKPVKISVENRSGGRKHLTHIKGLPALFVEPNAVAEYLQRRLASAASVCRGPSKAADDIIVTVQGKMVDPVYEALTMHFSIPRAYVER